MLLEWESNNYIMAEVIKAWRHFLFATSMHVYAYYRALGNTQTHTHPIPQMIDQADSEIQIWIFRWGSITAVAQACAPGRLLNRWQVILICPWLQLCTCRTQSSISFSLVCYNQFWITPCTEAHSTTFMTLLSSLPCTDLNLTAFLQSKPISYQLQMFSVAKLLTVTANPEIKNEEWRSQKQIIDNSASRCKISFMLGW